MTAALAVLAATSAWAAEDVFHVIPSDALAFGAANRIAETSGKVQKIAKQVGAPAVSVLDLAKAFTGATKGIDDARAAAFVVMPGKDSKSEPVPVFLIPVADYKQFLASWDAKPGEKGEKVVEVMIAGAPVLIGQRGSYAAISPNQRQFRLGLEKLLDAKRSIADEHPQVLSWLNENDAVEVATSYGLKWAAPMMQRQLQQMEEMFARMNMNQEGPSPLTGLRMYLKVLQWAEKEVDVVGIAARVDKQGAVRITTRTRFTKDSTFIASLAKLQPIEKGPLAGLPAGPFVAAGGGPWSDAITDALMGMQSDFMKKSFSMVYGLDEKQAEQFAKAIRETPKGLRSFSMLLEPGQPGAPIFGNMLALQKVEDSEKYLADYEKYVLKLNEAAKNPNATDAKNLISVKKTKVGEMQALETEMNIQQPPKAAALPGFQEKMAKIFGPGGKFKTTLVAVDKQTIVVSFADHAPSITRAIAALKQPADALAADSDVAQTAAMLPADAQWVGYFSPSGAVAFAKWIVTTMTPEGGFRPNIPDFPASPPIGLAAKALPGELQTEAVLPPSVVEAIGKYVGLVRSAEHPEVP
jgi:hypothetical protein